ncbi:MAG: family 20 glycosylhydrolase [Chitinophagaceae bacterium]|nr:family 20 glycosylhydrolase [Chitinophagaceae bacterium]
MKRQRIYIILITLFFTNVVSGQINLPVLHDSLFTTYYHQRWTLFKLLPPTSRDIIFLGNSITDGGEWSEMFNDLRIKNRGISGDVSAGILKRLDEVVMRRPSKVFLMIGVNDLARGLSTDSVVRNILLTAAYLKSRSPLTRLFVQSILPVTDFFKKFSGHTSKTDSILIVNDRLARAAEKAGFTFVNLYPFFCDAQGKLDHDFTNDGLHLTGQGFLLWKHLVFPHVFDLQNQPALLPLPKKLKWNKGFFPLYLTRSIIISDTILTREALFLKENILDQTQVIVSKAGTGANEFQIELRLDPAMGGTESEAYRLQVTPTGIRLFAATAHGIFNGIQTLRQLMRDRTMVDCCEISDHPSFPWRGFMTDVGRNYMSLPLLKEQIDIMSKYKLNVFHFHVTEDIAWRIAVRQYPQLTEAEHMLRDKGQYYSPEEVKELIAYCRERHIRFVPEIDMPGHSAAFKRAMGTEMQTDSGLKICKNILKELCSNFDLKEIHIGGDEVRITNKNFMPEIVRYLRSLGKTVVAWDPGGNVPEGTYLQMWNGKTVPRKKYPSIDSRHLYLNHFDPLEGVIATFNHIICDVDSASEDRLGATLCNWPDRRVADENDMIKMNAVYPVMLSFAERCWQGGGVKNFSSVITQPAGNDPLSFREFELRLTDQQKLYFQHKPFPYVTQSGIEWKLIGPFANEGNTTTRFAPELVSFPDTAQLHSYRSVFGGTIWLRHFWDPVISSHLLKPDDSTTWYATRRIWMEEAGEKECWIGFNNISRSPNTDSPPVGAWDLRSSKVWVNGQEIPPPKWKRGGQKGNSEIPLTDEGYEYRVPSKVYFKKGWNTVLLKAPVGSFKGEWQNPVKWMFTFVCFDE